MNAPAPLDTIVPLIGNTPLLKVKNFDTGCCELFLKLESQNPGGSIKDRIGISMIDAAEKAGHLAPGKQTKLVEATAGNTGLGLALVAARRGYELTLVIPDKMSQEKIFHVKALGAKVVMTRSDVGKGHPEYYVDKARRIAKETGAFFINQFENPANPLAHELTTGPELFEQMGGKIDAVVAGVGSGGTLTGLSRYFEKAIPGCEMVLADPVGSALAGIVNEGKPSPGGSYLVEGIGQDAVPPVCDFSRTKKAYSIPDGEALGVIRDLLKKEGVFAGSSSGTLIAAALRYCREQKTPKRVVTFVCDTGGKYLSKAYNDYWMADQGFMQSVAYGDLRDLIGRKAEAGAVVSVQPDDPLALVHARMKMADVSQLPVLDGPKLVGLIDESDLLLAAVEEGGFKRPVREVMTSRLETVTPKTPVKSLMPIFERGLVAIVVDGEQFLGLVTRIDLLNWLRRRANT
ncbi:MAG: pyridoxal-phosphate dependent enzyme [Myxococcota bacterium]